MPTPKLGGCPTQFVNHLSRLKGLLETLKPCLAGATEDDGQLLFQLLIPRLHTYMEAYYRCMVSLATTWDPECVRAYLCKAKPDQSDNIPGLPVADLGRWAAAEVAFNVNARGLRGIVRAVFNVDVFPDVHTESKCLDLITVRNVCVHQLGIVSHVEAALVKTPGVIVPSGRVGNTTFYRLHLSSDFIIECMNAVGTAVQHLGAAANADERFFYPDEEDD